MRLLGVLKDFILVANILFLVYIFYSHFYKNFRTLTGNDPASEEINSLDKPSFIYLTLVFAVLITQGAFINKPLGISPLLSVAFVGQVGWKIAVHTEKILLLGSCFYLIFYGPLRLLKAAAKNSMMRLWILFTIYISLRTIFQEHSIHPDVYHSQLVVCVSLIACTIAINALRTESLYFLARTALLFINGLSLFLSLLSTSFTFSDQFSGGSGLKSRLMGITQAPNILAFFASLGLLLFFFERQRKFQMGWRFGFVTCLINLILSGSRGGTLTALILLLLIQVYSVRREILVTFRPYLIATSLWVTVSVLLLVGVSLPLFATRMPNYLIVRSEIPHYFLVGMGSYKLIEKESGTTSYVHNQLLQTALEFGVLGTIVLFLIFASWAVKSLHSNGNQKALSLALFYWCILSFLGENPIRVHNTLYILPTIFVIMMTKIGSESVTLEGKLARETGRFFESQLSRRRSALNET